MAGIEKLCPNDAFFIKETLNLFFRQSIFWLEYLKYFDTIVKFHSCKREKRPTFCGQYDEKYAIVAIGGGVAMMQIIKKCIKMHVYRGVHKQFPFFFILCYIVTS